MQTLINKIPTMPCKDLIKLRNNLLTSESTHKYIVIDMIDKQLHTMSIEDSLVVTDTSSSEID